MLRSVSGSTEKYDGTLVVLTHAERLTPARWQNGLCCALVGDCSVITRTMLVRIDPTATEPLYTQIASCVRGAISRGEVTAGERLPTVRELAASLGVNMHTIRAAYAELRDEGLLEMRRGRNVSVIATHPGHAELTEQARGLVRTARRLGLSDADIYSLLEASL